MRRAALLVASLATAAGALAHGHPANVDPALPDAWKYRLCGEMATVAIQALHDRDRGKPMRSYPADGTPAATLADAIARHVFEELQISSPKKAETFGRGYCMERLQQ